MIAKSMVHSPTAKDFDMCEFHSCASLPSSSASASSLSSSSLSSSASSLSSPVLLFSIPHNDDIEEALRILETEDWDIAKPFFKPWSAQQVTPVHVAAYRGMLLGMQRAAALHVDLNATDNLGRCALHYAADQGHVDVVKWLVYHLGGNGEASGTTSFDNPQLSLQDACGNTPLHAAINGRHTDVVRLLVNAGSNVNAQNKKSCTPLFLAGAILSRISDDEKIWYEKIVDILVSESVGSVNIGDPITGVTPLHHAVELNSCKATKRLLEAGARLEDCYSGSWGSPLHIAAERGFYELLSILLSQRNSWNYKKFDMPNKLGWTPLYAAAYGGHLKCVRSLVDNGGSLASETNDGDTAIDALLKHGARAMSFLTDILDAQVCRKDKTADVILDFRMLVPQDELQMAVVSALIRAIPSTKKMNILQHPLLDAFLQYKWSRFRYFCYIILVVQCFFVFALSAYAASLLLLGKDPLFLRWPLLSCACFLFCHDWLQVLTMPKYFVKQYDIWLSVICEAISIVIAAEGDFILDANTAVPLEDPDDPSDISQARSWILQTAGMILPIAFGQLMLAISHHLKIGKHVPMITSVLTNILKGLLVVFVLLGVFSVIFMILSNGNEQFFSAWRTFMTMIMMISMGECEDQDSSSMTDEKLDTIGIVFFIVVLFISITLMNLMIAVSDIQELIKVGYTRQLLGLTKLMIFYERVAYSRIFRHRFTPNRLKKFLSKSMVDAQIELEWAVVNEKCPRGISEEMLDYFFDLATKNSNFVDELGSLEYISQTDLRSGNKKDILIDIQSTLQRIVIELQNMAELVQQRKPQRTWE